MLLFLVGRFGRVSCSLSHVLFQQPLLTVFAAILIKMNFCTIKRSPAFYTGLVIIWIPMDSHVLRLLFLVALCSHFVNFISNQSDRDRVRTDFNIMPFNQFNRQKSVFNFHVYAEITHSRLLFLVALFGRRHQIFMQSRFIQSRETVTPPVVYGVVVFCAHRLDHLFRASSIAPICASASALNTGSE
jgi:hypothetical protein